MPHISCASLPPLRECKQIGSVGFAAAKTLLDMNAMEWARDYACQIVALTGGKSLCRRVKALGKGLLYLRTG